MLTYVELSLLRERERLGRTHAVVSINFHSVASLASRIYYEIFSGMDLFPVACFVLLMIFFIPLFLSTYFFFFWGVLNIWQYVPILKLYRFVPLFRNSILVKSSFNEKLAWFKIELCLIKFKKINKNCIELEFHIYSDVFMQFFYKFNIPGSGSPIAAF